MEKIYATVFQLWETYTILWIIIAKVCIIAFIGFFRSVAQNRTPSYLWNQHDFLNRLIATGNSFAVLFTPVFALFGFLYNAFAWFIYGLTTIFDGFIWVMLWLWKWLVFVCKWVYENIIDPGIFYLIKVIWRYFFVWPWYFFKTSWDHLRINFPLKIYKIAYLGSAIVGFVILLFVIFIPAMLPVGIAVAIIVSSFFAARILSELNPDYPAQWAGQILKKATTWFGLSLGIVLLILLINYLVYGFFLQICLFGITMGLGSVMSIILLFFVVLFVFTQYMLPAHIYHYKGEVRETVLLGEIGKNFLKYPLAGIFSIIPVFIIVLIPLFIVTGAYRATERLKTEVLKGKTEQIAKALQEKQAALEVLKDTSAFSDAFEKKSATLATGIAKKEIRLYEMVLLNKPFRSLLCDTAPRYRSLDEPRKNLSDAVNAISETDTLIKATEAGIVLQTEAIKIIDSLKKMILPDGITAGKDVVTSGNAKKFGVPSVSGTLKYVWKLLEGNPQKESKIEETGSNTAFILMPKGGEFMVEVTPVNECGENTARKSSVNFTIASRPKSTILPRPAGPSETCTGSEVTFNAQGGFDNYVFRFPENVKIQEQKKNQIKVIWGNTAGNVSFSASDKEGTTLSSNPHFVKVSAKPGIDIRSENEAAELTDPSFPNESFFYSTIEEADDSVNVHQGIKDELKQYKSYLLNLKAKQFAGKHAAESALSINRWFNIKYTIGLILLALALASLLAFVLMFVMIYTTRYNFFLYSFKREGPFYIVGQFHEYRTKNPNQPLMGLLLSSLVIILLVFIIRGSLLVVCFNWVSALFGI